MISAALFLSLAFAHAPAFEEVDLQAQVQKLERRLQESIDDAKLQAKKEAELESTMRQMEQKLQELGASLETSRKLYPDSVLEAFEDSDDDVTGKKSTIPELPTAMGTTWTILCGALVMFMHAGFALLETGVCRAVSCQSILMKNILNVCFGTMIWFIFGYAFMYGGVDDSPLPVQIIGGMSGYFGSGMVDPAAGEIGMGYIGPN